MRDVQPQWWNDAALYISKLLSCLEHLLLRKMVVFNEQKSLLKKIRHYTTAATDTSRKGRSSHLWDQLFHPHICCLLEITASRRSPTSLQARLFWRLRPFRLACAENFANLQNFIKYKRIYHICVSAYSAARWPKDLKQQMFDSATKKLFSADFGCAKIFIKTANLGHASKS